MADLSVSPIVLYSIAVGSVGLVLFVLLSRKLRKSEVVSEVSEDTGKAKTVVFKSRDDDPMMEFNDSPSVLDRHRNDDGGDVGDGDDGDDGPPPLHDEDTEQVLYDNCLHFTEEEVVQRSKEYYQLMNRRRSVRHFSSRPVPREAIERIIHTAGTSPSGAHSEPWSFVVVEDPSLKAQIRTIVEEEEYVNYDRRMGEKWVQDLQFINTNYEKPYLDEAPYLIVVFKKPYSITASGHRQPHYYFEVSTAIASGFLVSAIHYAGLVTVTTTPMNAGGQIRQLLGRPDNEKVMLLLPVGYPIDGVKVPGVGRKPLEEILVWK